MIFAELDYPEDYWDVHDEIKNHICANFQNVESGIQSDPWFWIFDGREKVVVDTFTSVKHQVKSPSPGPHVQKVIAALKLKYRLNIYPEPELEGHEDA